MEDRKTPPPRTPVPRAPTPSECLRADMDREEAYAELDAAKAKMKAVEKFADALLERARRKTSGEHRIDLAKLRPVET